MAKRKIFNELMEGVAAMDAQRQGKLTLRSYKVKAVRAPRMNARTIRETRESLNFSRPVFARKLHINERTLEKWEQGRAKPNPQAATLLLLVSRYPDMLERLESIAGK
ncbi:MAG TPA: helix-turn-helix domain-containing protein [Candidatus Angelobacter sp.]|jgi:putative transcriptional regulator